MDIIKEEVRKRKNKYVNNSLLPKRYCKKDIPLYPCEADEKVFEELAEIKDNIKEFVSSGKNLYICSRNAGNGKTSWAAKLLMAYIDTFNDYTFYEEKCPALFINVSKVLQERKMSIENKGANILDRVQFIDSNILSADLVIFDDIGDKSLSDYDMDLLYYWIDSRTADLKSSIYTSNCVPEDLQKVVTEKIFSRIVGYSDIKVFVDGDNRVNDNATSVN